MTMTLFWQIGVFVAGGGLVLPLITGYRVWICWLFVDGLLGK